MSKYVYPAIFTSEPDGGYSVYFPDLKVVIPAATHWLMLCLWLKMPSRLFSMDMKRTNAPFHSPPKCQTSKLLRFFLVWLHAIPWNNANVLITKLLKTLTIPPNG